MSKSNAQPNRHTPEPWAAVRNTAYWEIGTEIDGYYANRIGDVCSADPNNPDSGKQEANANRIVACVNACKGINPEAVPELLAACVEAESLVSDCEDQDGTNCGLYRPVLKRLRAALAKAKGGAA